MKLFLIIDDDEVDIMIHSKIISKAVPDAIVSYENNVSSALEYLKGIEDKLEEWPDYILLDVNIPGMDGFQFLENYKTFPEKYLKKCQIFMLSSSENFRDMDKARKNPLVNDYLLKPLQVATAEKLFL